MKAVLGALHARLRSGEEAALEEWVRAETPRLLAFVRRLVGDEEAAREVVRGTFVRALARLRSGDGAGLPRDALERMVLEAAAQHPCSQRGALEPSIAALLPSFDENGRRVDAGPRWPALPVRDGEGDGALRRAVQACLARLPEPHRLALVLRDVEGLDARDAAALLGIDERALRARLHRARQALRSLLDPYVRDARRAPSEGSARLRSAAAAQA